MASESSSADFGDPFLDVVAADLYAVSILSISLSVLVLRMQRPDLPYNSDFLAFDGECLPRDIFGLPPSPQVPQFSTIEYIHIPSLERPPEAPPALGSAQDAFRSLQPPHEVSYFQAWTTTTPSDSDNAVRTVSLFFVEPTVLRVSGFLALNSFS